MDSLLLKWTRFFIETTPNFASFIREQNYSSDNSTKALEKIRDRLEQGPSFQEFVQDPDNTHGDWESYAGKLKRDKGDDKRLRLPPWLKKEIPIGAGFNKIKEQLRGLKLATVCEEAKCPNIGECWGGGEHGTQTATIMVNTVLLILPMFMCLFVCRGDNDELALFAINKFKCEHSCFHSFLKMRTLLLHFLRNS